MGSQLFTVDGNWNWPAGVNTVTAELIGGGGGGGTASGNPATGGGGQGGAYSKKTITKGVESFLEIDVGNGGGAGASGAFSAITQNGTVVARASGGGGGANAASNSTNGAGGSTPFGVLLGDTTFVGGNGGTGNYTSGVQGSGAGGGSAGPSSAGGNASVNTAGTSGTGNFADGVNYSSDGAAGVGNSTNGLNAPSTSTDYGGGGSGGKANNNPDRTGGSGRQGIVLLSWADPAAPTVTLDIANGHSFSTPTPALEFTGTDVNNDDIRYNLEIQSSVEGVADTYPFDSGNSTTSISTTEESGQTFQGNGSYLTKASFKITKNISGQTGNIRACLYDSSNGTPTSTTPIESSANIDISSLPFSATVVEFNFAGTSQLLNNSEYAIVVDNNTDDIVLISINTTGSGHSGRLVTKSSVPSWSGTSWDCCFIVKTNPSPIRNVVSGTDAGFTNTVNAGDTDPFTQNQKISYTVQNALSDGTYYWRVRGLDPNGGNTYGSWSSIRSFTISAPPTIVLNTTDGQSFGTSTPTLEATATDPQSNDVRYNFQIGTIPPFTAGLLDSYSESNQDNFSNLYSGSNIAASQSFVSNGGAIYEAKFYIRKTGTPGSVYAKVYATTGTHGTNALPTGAAISTSEAVSGAGLSTNFTLVTFTFTSPVLLNNGQTYCIVLEHSAGDASNYIGYGFDSSSSTGSGNSGVYSTFWGSASSNDLIFYIYSQPDVISDGYDFSNASGNAMDLIAGVRLGIGQSFTGNGGYLKSVKFSISKGGNNPVGNIVVKIYASTGSHGTNAYPTGSALAISDPIDASTLSSSVFEQKTFVFSSDFVLVNSTIYIVTLEWVGDGSKSIHVSTDESSSTHPGNASQYTFSGTYFWASGGTPGDYLFEVKTSVIIRDKVSNTDAGFTNTVNGGDTDPFNSGEKVSYTVQSPLSNGTYYYRARAIDPSGSNTYGSWTSSRSFVISISTQSPKQLGLLGVG